jgi:hypothetical protein
MLPLAWESAMSIAPFSSERELIDYAKWFLRDRANAFRKDIEICMTANSDRQHAYFPALITCISFLDLLSGLYAGKIDGHGAHELKDYIKRFMNAPNYAHMDLLYQMFRHKIAHIAYPYPVFDTTTKPKLFFLEAKSSDGSRGWYVQGDATRPIQLIDYASAQAPIKTKVPWPVPYDSRIIVSVRRLKNDITKSIREYLHCLKSEPIRRMNFAKCMKVYFPP